MKAISIKEPWASLIKNGLKDIETRTWATKYRGPLLLCASKYPKSDISGHAFAKCNLVAIRPMLATDKKRACCEIYPKAQAWILKDIEIITPFPVKGQLGISCKRPIRHIL